MLPKEPNMLVSYINMGLRDKYEDLADMAASEGFDVETVKATLITAGFKYDDVLKKFIKA